MNLRSIIYHHWGNTFVVLLLSIGFLCTISVAEQKKPAEQVDWIRASKLLSQYGVQDIDGFVSDKLRTHRIVMLGDGRHHQPLFQQRVISVLNRWVDTIVSEQDAQSPPLPQRLALMLEPLFVPKSIEYMKAFLTSGDLNEILQNYLMKDMFISEIEFYTDLRILYQRIAYLNTHRPQDAQLMFDLLFPEKEINIAEWTIQKRDDFLVKGRDEYIFSRVMDYLENHPTAKVFMFYGNGHLQRGKAAKIMPPRSPEPRYGYFVAHYLKEKFPGSTGCYTIRQWNPADIRLNISIPIAVDFDLFREDPSSEESLQFFIDRDIQLLFDRDRGDAVICYREPYPTLHLVAGVPSINVFKSLIVHYERCLYEGAFLCMGQKGLSEGILYFFSGEVMPKDVGTYYVRAINYGHPVDHRMEDRQLARWKDWLSSYHRDGVAAVLDLSYFHPFLQSLEKAQNPEKVLYMWRFPIQTFAPELAQFSSTDPKKWKTYLQKHRKEIVIPKLIDFLWVGTPEEKEKALAALLEETSQDFRTAKEWTLWWRGKEKASSLSPK